MTKKPIKLRFGDRINAEGIGVLTVTAVLSADPDGGVEVDVEPERGCDIWDMPALAASVGAAAASWLSNTPQWLYRLYFDPQADVTILDPAIPQT